MDEVAKDVKFTCKLCGFTFQSLLLDKEQALMEIYQKTVKHLETVHPKMQKSIALTIHTAASYITTVIMHRHVFGGLSVNSSLKTQFDAELRALLNIIGYEPKQDESTDPPENLDKPLVV